MAQPDSDTVDVAYIAARTGYSPVSVHRWHHAGLLPPLVGERPRRWLRRQVDDWLCENFQDVEWAQ